MRTYKILDFDGRATGTIFADRVIDNEPRPGGRCSASFYQGDVLVARVWDGFEEYELANAPAAPAEPPAGGNA